ncbi:MAG: secretin N-terminal domain-containing protein, partial [Pirellulales bacterium]
MPILVTKDRRWELLRQCGGPLALASVLLLTRAAVGQLAPAAQPSLTDAGVATASSAPEATLTYRAYPLQHLDAATARQRLAEMLAAAPGLDVVVDSPRHRVLVRGNPQTHQLVAQALSNLDREPVGESPAQANSAAQTVPKIAAFPLNDATRGVLGAWQQHLAGRPDVRFAIDERTSQVLVYAPPAVHTQIHQQLAQAGVAGATPQV